LKLFIRKNHWTCLCSHHCTFTSSHSYGWGKLVNIRLGLQLEVWFITFGEIADRRNNPPKFFGTVILTCAGTHSWSIFRKAAAALHLVSYISQA